MLKVFFGDRDSSIQDSIIDVYFDNNYDSEWFEDDIVKRMVYDIDKTEVKSKNCLESPVLGQIPPMYLSGGVKALILMYKTDLVVDATSCGENCVDWIIRLGDMRDVDVDLNYYMPLKPNENGILIVNSGNVVNTVYDFNKEALKYLGGIE